jgi:Xaa-Pro aminopeptidase
MRMNRDEIDLQACRGRQERLLGVMHQLDVELVIVQQIEHVQWLVGPRFAWVHQPAAALLASGELLLVAPDKEPALAAADRVVTYPAKWLSTLRNDQRQACAEVLDKALPGARRGRRVAVEFSTFTRHLRGVQQAELVDIEPQLYRLRRRKDADELGRLRRAISATGRMYERAREIVRPGRNELDVFNELQAVAVRELGEMLTGTGNDYRCAARGGPPRDRGIEAGELYILDLGPAFRGYFADNCRTLAVGAPSDLQQRAWEQVVSVFPLVERSVRPGASARALFHEVQSRLAQAPVGVFDHHLGHGIGLFPHEAPHLNPHWDDCFEVGDVVAVEPGLYAPELRAGLRIENDYLVTQDGVELLSDFPLQLQLET